jgi:hypothetical protein
MRKTRTPLTILVTDPAMLEWSQVHALVAQGHTLEPLRTAADLILGPQCHFMVPAMASFLELAVKAAQARRKRGAHE